MGLAENVLQAFTGREQVYRLDERLRLAVWWPAANLHASWGQPSVSPRLRYWLHWDNHRLFSIAAGDTRPDSGLALVVTGAHARITVLASPTEGTSCSRLQCSPLREAPWQLGRDCDLKCLELISLCRIQEPSTGSLLLEWPHHWSC
jgi:hypothetical protein